MAINKLLANLQGKDYQGPQPLQAKRVRKPQQAEAALPQPQQQPQHIEVEIKEEAHQNNTNNTTNN